MNPVLPRAADGTRPKTDPVAVVAAPKSSQPGVLRYLAPGLKIADRYEVLGVLGEGGMGVVYRCRDKTGELLAVKRVVLPEENADEHLAWFVAEAQALAGLCHDNIVEARDFGQLRDGTPYLAMELVSGVSLHELICDPQPLSLLWTLTDQVLAALAHAHARGVVHGDLKPSNVVVEDGGGVGPRARLFDFGLAKRFRRRLDVRLGQKSAPSHPPPSAGTPGYMAPEQILGRRSEICPATDLYALGCILYRALAGRAPFVSENRRELDFHCYREPLPLEPQVEVPHGLVPFVMRLLEKRPWDRASSAADVRAEWAAFRPEACGDDVLPVDARRSRAERDEHSTGAEVTRRISPRGERSTAARLRRSNRWLPGLLSVRPSPLVGRSALCRHLFDRFEAVAAEPKRRLAVMLTGPAGVGKSRLADWLCTEVEESGAAIVLRGFCAGAPGRDALALSLAERFGTGAGALRTISPALAERCAPEDLGALVDWMLRRLDPATDSSRGLGDPRSVPSLLRVLVAVAQNRPLLLWLDDPSELCPETLSLLAVLPRQAPDLRLMVVTTARAEALAKPAAVACVRSLRVALDTEFVPVPPLDSLTTSAMLRAAHPIDSALALQIALDSNGIPLDALERLFALARRGRVA